MSGRPDAQRRSDEAQAEDTAGRWKRAAAAVLGGILVVRGLRRRSLSGTVTTLAGGWLLSRALGEDSPIDRVRDVSGGSDRGEPKRARGTEATTVSRSVTIGKPADELYEAWRDPDTFARSMGHVADVESIDGDRHAWTVDGPLGRTVSWETRIVEDEPGELVRWETPPDARLPNEGTVRFRPAPGDRGTVVTLRVRFDPPGGRLGDAAMERLDLVPEVVVGRALDRFKSLVETGTVPTLDRNPSARGQGDLV